MPTYQYPYPSQQPVVVERESGGFLDYVRENPGWTLVFIVAFALGGAGIASAAR